MKRTVQRAQQEEDARSSRSSSSGQRQLQFVLPGEDSPSTRHAFSSNTTAKEGQVPDEKEEQEQELDSGDEYPLTVDECIELYHQYLERQRALGLGPRRKGTHRGARRLEDLFLKGKRYYRKQRSSDQQPGNGGQENGAESGEERQGEDRCGGTGLTARQPSSPTPRSQRLRANDEALAGALQTIAELEKALEEQTEETAIAKRELREARASEEKFRCEMMIKIAALERLYQESRAFSEAKANLTAEKAEPTRTAAPPEAVSNAAKEEQEGGGEGGQGRDCQQEGNAAPIDVEEI